MNSINKAQDWLNSGMLNHVEKRNRKYNISK